MGKETHRPLAMFRAVRGFKRRRTPSRTPPQNGFLRHHDPTILHGTEIAQRVLGYFSFPLRVPLGDLSPTRIQSLPEICQPPEPFRTVLGESVVLGSSETHGFYSRRDRSVRADSRVIEAADVQALRSFFVRLIVPTFRKGGVRLRSQGERDVLQG